MFCDTGWFHRNSGCQQHWQQSCQILHWQMISHENMSKCSLNTSRKSLLVTISQWRYEAAISCILSKVEIRLSSISMQAQMTYYKIPIANHVTNHTPLPILSFKHLKPSLLPSPIPAHLLLVKCQNWPTKNRKKYTRQEKRAFLSQDPILSLNLRDNS